MNAIGGQCLMVIASIGGLSPSQMLEIFPLYEFTTLPMP
jgi:hypothetical protein